MLCRRTHSPASGVLQVPMGWWRLQRPAPGPSAQPRPVVQVREVPYGQAPAGPWRVPGPEWSCRARGGELRNRGWATRPIRTRSMGRGPGPGCGCRKVPDQPEDPSGRGGGGRRPNPSASPSMGPQGPRPTGPGWGLCVGSLPTDPPGRRGERPPSETSPLASCVIIVHIF